MEWVFNAVPIKQQMLLYLFCLNTLFVVLIIFVQKKEPKSVWAWLVFLYCLPIPAAVFYLFLGTDMQKKKMFRLKEAGDRLQNAVRKQEKYVKDWDFEIHYAQLLEYKDLILYNLKCGGNVLTDGNDIQIFTAGADKFQCLIQDLESAKESIHMQYYIIKDDVVFGTIEKILKQKAKDGIKVRILLDGMGCRGLGKKKRNALQKAGVETAIFFPPAFGRLHLRINYRNHRKIVVIDNHIGYVGGFNIGKEYVGLDSKFGNWRDTHLRIEGAGVFSLQLRFLMDYNYASGQNISLDQQYLSNIPSKNGNSILQIITCGPDSSIPLIRNNYLRLIHKAKQSICIQTPYFVPDEAVMSALLIAIQSGIDVSVMIPCKPDHMFVYWASLSYAGELILAGASCYAYQKGFLHAKGMIVDNEVYCYGTANMDIRSFSLNFEVNAVVYGKEDANRMKQAFCKDLEDCIRITAENYEQRTWQIRFKESISRLLAPIL